MSAGWGPVWTLPSGGGDLATLWGAADAATRASYLVSAVTAAASADPELLAAQYDAVLDAALAEAPEDVASRLADVAGVASDADLATIFDAVIVATLAEAPADVVAYLSTIWSLASQAQRNAVLAASAHVTKHTAITSLATRRDAATAGDVMALYGAGGVAAVWLKVTAGSGWDTLRLLGDIDFTVDLTGAGLTISTSSSADIQIESGGNLVVTAGGLTSTGVTARVWMMGSYAPLYGMLDADIGISTTVLTSGQAVGFGPCQTDLTEAYLSALTVHLTGALRRGYVTGDLTGSPTIFNSSSSAYDIGAPPRTDYSTSTYTARTSTTDAGVGVLASYSRGSLTGTAQNVTASASTTVPATQAQVPTLYVRNNASALDATIYRLRAARRPS